MSLMEIEIDKNQNLVSEDDEKYSAIKKVLNLSREEMINKLLDLDINEGINTGVNIGHKWGVLSGISADEKIFICNAYERNIKLDFSQALIESNVLSILKGIIIGAYICKANEAYIYICNENKKIIEKIEEVIDVMKEDNLLGENILGTEYDLNIIVKPVARESIYGDEIASINILENKLNKKDIKKYPTIRELNNKFTTISRVETLLKVSRVFEEDNEEIATCKFIEITYKDKNSQVFTVPINTTLREIIFKKCNIKVDESKLKGILVGGNVGVLLSKELLDISLDDEKIKFAEVSKTISIELIDEDTCIIDFVRTCMNNSQGESCNKCVFCREGSIQISTILNDITEGKGKNEDINLLKQISNGMNIGAGCGFGKAISNPVSSALEYFGDEFEDHIKKKKCSSLVCKKYFSYHILGNKCLGCEECIDECPVEAIDGKRKFIHVIDQDECIKCGKCENVCEYEAIVKAGIVKPKTPNRPVPVGSWKRR